MHRITYTSSIIGRSRKGKRIYGKVLSTLRRLIRAVEIHRLFAKPAIYKMSGL